MAFWTVVPPICNAALGAPDDRISRPFVLCDSRATNVFRSGEVPFISEMAGNKDFRVEHILLPLLAPDRVALP